MDHTVTVVPRISQRHLQQEILAFLPEGTYRKVFIKPNWVKHQESVAFSIGALVTDSRVIDATIQACLEKYPSVEELTIGDVPLQTCDFDKLLVQSGMTAVMKRYDQYRKPSIRFMDLRRERWIQRKGYMELVRSGHGDPAGYTEVVLDAESMLEGISDNSHRFRVSDYDPGEIRSAHYQGHHRYLVAQTILDSELFINIPKLKTHQKAGITAALKNLVGINGKKSFLVHHQRGIAGRGGDEFPPDVGRTMVLQARVREYLQKRNRFAFVSARSAWQLMKKMRGIHTEGTRENLKKNFFVASGGWYGNDSIWRMVYDLNMILFLAGRNGGQLQESAQRDYVCILDASVSGEGNGPLQPLPVATDLILSSRNPFALDWSAAKLMGFDPTRIPTLANFQQFRFRPLVQITPKSFPVRIDLRESHNGIDSISVLHRFVPPPGWEGKIELAL